MVIFFKIEKGLKMGAKKSWVGMVVRTKIRLETALGILPAKTICMVTKNSYSTRLRLISRPCHSCGIMFKVNEVESRQVIIVEEDKKYLSRRKCDRCRQQYVFKAEGGYICPHCGVDFKYHHKSKKDEKNN